jgi:hypothetical protein
MLDHDTLAGFRTRLAQFLDERDYFYLSDINFIRFRLIFLSFKA